MVDRYFTFLQSFFAFLFLSSSISLNCLIFSSLWPTSVHSLPLEIGVVPIEDASIPHTTDIPNKYGLGWKLNLLLSKSEYDQFQISEGYGGTAQEQAAALFEEPLKGIELEDIPYKVYEHLNLMWEAIEYANVISFPHQLETAQASGDDQLASALDVGWTKNDILMKMAQVQIAKIRIAKMAKDGSDTWEEEGSLQRHRDDLMVAVAADKRNSGLASQSVELVYGL